MRIRPTRHNECEITTEDGIRITIRVDAQPPADNKFVTLKRFIELELAKIEPQWTAEGKGSYWWGVKIGLETVLAKLCENAPQPEHRRYDPYGSLSEYGIFPECDAQPPAEEDERDWLAPAMDEMAEWRMDALEAGSEDGLQAEVEAQESECPPTGDEVVFIDGVGAWRNSIKSCHDGVQWIRVGDRIYWPLSDADAKRLQSACCGNGSFDGPATPAGEGEEIMVNTSYGVFILPLQPSELSSGPRFVVHVPSVEAPAVKALMEALETCLEMEERPEVIELAKTALAAARQLAKDGCHCGTCTCDPNMTPAVRFDLSPAQQEGVIRDHLIRLGWTPPVTDTEAEAMVDRIATLLYEEATAEPSGPDRDYYRGLARKIVALVTKHQEPKP